MTALKSLGHPSTRINIKFDAKAGIFRGDICGEKFATCEISLLDLAPSYDMTREQMATVIARALSP